VSSHRCIVLGLVAFGWQIFLGPFLMRGPQALSFGRSLPCPSGKRVFSGGVQNANSGVVVQESHLNLAGDTWAYTVSRKTGGAVVTFTGWAVCATTTS